MELILLNCSSNKKLSDLDYLLNSLKSLIVNNDHNIKQLSNLPNEMEKIVFNTKITIHPIPKKLKLNQIFCTEESFESNKLNKEQKLVELEKLKKLKKQQKRQKLKELEKQRKLKERQKLVELEEKLKLN